MNICNIFFFIISLYSSNEICLFRTLTVTFYTISFCKNWFEIFMLKWLGVPLSCNLANFTFFGVFPTLHFSASNPLQISVHKLCDSCLLYSINFGIYKLNKFVSPTFARFPIPRTHITKKKRKSCGDISFTPWYPINIHIANV